MNIAQACVPVDRVSYRGGRRVQATARMTAQETPVAISYDGSSFAVMMASAQNLEDFGVGFSICEGVVADAHEIEALECVNVEDGVDIQIRLREGPRAALASRRRHMAGPVGCGLCGLESIEQALRPLPKQTQELTLTPREICQAMNALANHQPLHDQTRAAHAAGFYVPGNGFLAVREDVGRHNALDKLVGALARRGAGAQSRQTPALKTGPKGAVALTSRISVDMVQKAAILGAPVIMAVSAPTTLAISAAESAGVTLIALTRGDAFDVYTHAHRVADGAAVHVE